MRYGWKGRADDELEWGKLRSQRLSVGFSCITCVNTMFFPETWRDGRGAGLGVGAGTQRLTFKMPTKHSGGNDKEICYEFHFRREIWAGVRDMTSHMYV